MSDEKKVVEMAKENNTIETTKRELSDEARAFINDAFMLTVWKKKKLRAERFENFIKVNMNLTEEKNKPEDINFTNDFSIIISGTDQIWNKYSNELRKVDWKYMQPYLLKGFKGKKISYASSISRPVLKPSE